MSPLAMPSPGQTQHLAFAIGEWVEFSPGLGSQFRVNYPQTLLNAPNGVSECFRRAIFQKISRSAGIECAA